MSGGDLALRAYTQAWSFGAEYVYGSPACALRREDRELVVTVADGSEVRSRAVVVATGMAYRRLGIPELDALTGVGVFYGAAVSEAKAMKDREVYVVGGANSAGQAAVHLARYAARVTVLVRGRSLADSMSDYLIREIESASNITVRCRVEVTGGAGNGRLERLTLTDRETGASDTVDATALFVLIGAEPRTRVAARSRAARPVGIRAHRNRSALRRAAAARVAATAAAEIPGVQHARRLRRRRCPARLGQARRIGRRRGLYRHSPRPRAPARRLTVPRLSIGAAHLRLISQ